MTVHNTLNSNERAIARLKGCTLHLAASRIYAVYYINRKVNLIGLKNLKEIKNGAQICIIPAPHILQLHNKGINLLQILEACCQRLLLAAVKRDELHTFKQFTVTVSAVELNLVLQFPKQTVLRHKNLCKFAHLCHGLKQILTSTRMPCSLVAQHTQFTPLQHQIRLLKK